jgi:glutathione S-transferase
MCKVSPLSMPILWGVSVSPYVRKVRMVLAEKEIAYQHKETLPVLLLQATGQKIPSDFAAMSPMGKIPAFEDNGFNISDSSVICAYLEHRYPNAKALYPTQARPYARALWFERYAEDGMAKISYTKIFFELFVKPNVLKLEANQKVVEKAKNEELPPILDFLEKSLGGNDYLVENTFSIADISIVTQCIALEFAGYQVDELKWPQLLHYIKRVKERKAIQAIL